MPKLINGDDLIKHFKLHPSPLIGKILAMVLEAQAVSEIKTKTQAFELAKKVIKEKNRG